VGDQPHFQWLGPTPYRVHGGGDTPRIVSRPSSTQYDQQQRHPQRRIGSYGSDGRIGSATDPGEACQSRTR
jgi:hypothetical protein